jgi:YggT family protein
MESEGYISGGFGTGDRRKMIELLGFLRYCLHVYSWLVILSAVLSWLIGFGLVNYSNPNVRQIWKALNVVTEPLLAPIRNLLPAAGGIDFSPLVLLVAIIGVADYFIPFLMRTLG